MFYERPIAIFFLLHITPPRSLIFKEVQILPSTNCNGDAPVTLAKENRGSSEELAASLHSHVLKLRSIFETGHAQVTQVLSHLFRPSKPVIASSQATRWQMQRFCQLNYKMAPVASLSVHVTKFQLINSETAIRYNEFSSLDLVSSQYTHLIHPNPHKMYAQQILVTFLMATSATLASARSIERRQLLGNLGSLSCNVARLQILGALGNTEDAVSQITDTTVQDAANAGLQQARGGIAQIAKSIVSGAAPPAASRDEVAAGLAAAGTALSGGDASDQAVADAQAGLDKSVKAVDVGLKELSSANDENEA
ncbi:uncharacterized protein CLUP02_16761 [Colletotrichum lupini]|uniref:Uncharacterized protein n=1 Tax=Colletotrichum lupini TaxID=145971 RepID=A0A9Q8T8Q8_9PEZI|nr:uncharacterized protein CLUP02_16761 [Colletotrichum lupini]UQC91227.1 hypothetical protein CLUP02_16761 [Colletotrichum lupini]